MVTESKKSLIKAMAEELERFKNRWERSSSVGVIANNVHLDKAAYTILGRLVKAGPERLSSVAQYFSLDVSTISRHVAALEGEGLIERIADPNDGRAQLLNLTDAGFSLYDTLREKKVAIISEQLADWSKQDCALMVELLGRYNTAMEQRFGVFDVYVDREAK